MLSHVVDERRRLRLFEESDAEELSAVIEANRAYLAEWLPWAAGQTLEGTREFIRASRRQLADNQGLQVAIVEDGRIIGCAGYHRIDWGARRTSIGYWLAESAQGHGTATRVARALVDHAFTVWKLNRIEIRAGVENARSRAVIERVGFTQEGIKRQAELVGDRWIDHAVYSMLAEEWQSRREGLPAS